MASDVFNQLVNVEFDIAPDRLQALLPQVEIKYVDHDGTFLARVSRVKGEDNRTILVSDFFTRRIGVILATNQNNQLHDNAEYRILIIFLAVSLLHEVAHLMNRWSGLDSSANQDFEAGFFLEEYLFRSELFLAIVPNNENPALQEVVGNYVKKYF